MSDHTVVIVNPASGRGRGSRALPDIQKAFAAVGITDIRLTQGKGDERVVANRALQDGATTIVACGGDGTWSNVANAILCAGSSCRLALIASGTGNDFAKTVGAPATDYAATARLVREGADMLVDVGRIEGKYFLNVSGFGFDIAVLEDIETISWLKGDLVYLYSAVRQLFGYGGVPIDIASPTRRRGMQSHLMVVIANARNFGGMFRIAPEAEVTDGRLDAIAILDASPVGRMKLLAAVPKGAHIGNPNVVVEQAERFTLTFPAPPAYETDGEYNRAKSATIEVACVPQALRVVTHPAGAARA
jgi:diacylglycerol kinase (ATP)